MKKPHQTWSDSPIHEQIRTMNDTQTPRTDANVKRHNLCRLSGNDLVYADFPRQLERELTTVTEQRDRLLEQQEQWRLSSVCRELIEQRDKWKAKYIQQNKDLGHELRDPNGTIWSECKRLQTELTAVTEQRDRLAEALQACLDDSVELLGERDWWQRESRLNYQERYQETRNNVTRADEALQSLTTKL
jgi:hypothetical protein